MTRHTWFLDEVGNGRGGGMQARCKSGESIKEGVAAQKRRSYVVQQKRLQKAATTTQHWNESGLYTDRFSSSQESLIMIMHIVIFHSQDFKKISMSKYTLITV